LQASPSRPITKQYHYETDGWVEVKNGSIGVVDWVIIMMGLVLGIAFSLQKLIQCAEVAAKKDKGARYGK